MSSWKECKLGDIAEINMGQSPKSEFYNQDKIGLPFLQGNRTFGLKYPYFDTYCSEPTKIAKHGEILFSVRAPVGDINIANDEICIGRGLCSINSKDKNNEFLYYLLHFLKNEIINNESGSVFGSINRTDLSNINVLYPPIEEQKAIAEVLSSLDDKIDLLHRQNQTLESLAQTLFRQWFIEEVKEEWEEVLITDLFEVRDGTHDSPKQKEFGKKLLTSKHILKNKLDFESSYFISEEDFEKINQRSVVEQGDILFSMIGTIGLTYLEQSNEIDYAIKNIGLFKTSQNKKFMYFVYLWLNSSFGVEFIHENRSGSTQEYISLGSLRNIIFNLPNYKIIDLFNEKMEPIFEKINTNMKQIKSLENLRDTLLPKLLSGEVKL